MGHKKIDHNPEDGRYLKISYIVAIVLWTISILYYHYAFKVQFTILGTLILLVPILIWITGYQNGTLIAEDLTNELFDANFLAVSLLITIPLLSWLSTRVESQEKYVPLVMIGITLTLFSSLDFWVTKKWLALSKHIKSIFSTAAICIFIYAIYSFYLVYVKRPELPFFKVG